MFRYLFTSLLWLLLSVTLVADLLPRKAQLGVYPAAASSELLTKSGIDRAAVVVQNIVVTENAYRMGVRQGDIILSVNSTVVKQPQDLVEIAGTLSARDSVTLTVRRGEQTLSLSGELTGIPAEQFRYGVVELKEVDFDGGKLRSFLAKPHNIAKPPVIYYIGGYSCSTIETKPTQPNYFFFDSLLKAGFAVWRVEKPGIGDSYTKNTSCNASDLGHEIAAVKAGYNALKNINDVDHSRIYLFGHSMGGLVAPAIVNSDVTPAGIIVYGIGMQNWGDYLQDIIRYQAVTMGVVDPVLASDLATKAKPALTGLFDMGMSPQVVEQQYPDSFSALKIGLNWDGSELMMGRSILYPQSIHKTNNTELWSKVTIPVLAMAGESDMALIDPRDMHLLVHTVNHYHPGNATFKLIERTNHFLAEVGNREELRQHIKAGTLQSLANNYNPTVTSTIINWINSINKKSGDES